MKDSTTRVLVTGGNGYIGSHMCKLLYESGMEVHIIDNFSTSPSAPVHSFGQFHELDMADIQRMSDLVRKISPQGIFHFAARALVPEGEADPMLYYRENVTKTLKLLEICLANQVRKFIFSSTCATFGIPLMDSISEDHPQNPINTYGNTKKLIELIMRDLCAKKLLDVVTFRYFNASGCSPDGSLGENHEPETHLIPNLCKSALSGGSRPFKIMGTDYATRDGSCIRDYIHVDDLVRAHLLGYKFLSHESGFHDFNLGTEKGTSVLEMVEAFKKVTGSNLMVEHGPKRPGDPPILIGNSGKARRILGFDPVYSIEESILHTWNYEKKRGGKR